MYVVKYMGTELMVVLGGIDASQSSAADSFDQE